METEQERKEREEAYADGIAAANKAFAPMTNETLVEVTKEDANTYCRILSLLGMEEEGDPVDAVDQLQHKLAAANIHIAKLTAELAACKSRVELLEHDMKSGDYESLYAQTVHELAACREAAIEECAKVCDTAAANLLAASESKLRTARGKEIVLDKHYGALNLAVDIRALKGQK